MDHISEHADLININKSVLWEQLCNDTISKQCSSKKKTNLKYSENK